MHSNNLLIDDKIKLVMEIHPKHTPKSKHEWVGRKKLSILNWAAMSPDLNPIKTIWSELKSAVGENKLLEQMAKEERGKTTS